MTKKNSNSEREVRVCEWCGVEIDADRENYALGFPSAMWAELPALDFWVGTFLQLAADLFDKAERDGEVRCFHETCLDERDELWHAGDEDDLGCTWQFYTAGDPRPRHSYAALADMAHAMALELAAGMDARFDPAEEMLNRLRLNALLDGPPQP